MELNSFIINVLGLVILFLFVMATLAIAEILKRKQVLSGNISRKIIHIVVGNVVIAFPIVFSNVWIALIGPVFFIFFTYLTCPGSPIKKLRLKSIEEGHTYGTVFYALSLTVLVALFFEPDEYNQKNVILFASFLPLVWGDGISAVIGSKYGEKGSFMILKDKKSLIGSWSLAIASFFIVSLVLSLFHINFYVAVYIGLVVSLVSTLVEAVSPKGIDNITIPTFNALVLYGLYKFLNEDFNSLQERISSTKMLIALILAVSIAIISISIKALTWDGALAGFYFGTVILGLGGWSWGAMYFTFFFIGSATTFIGKKRKKEALDEFEKGSTARDSMQASVNSIVPAIAALLSVLFPSPLFFVISAGALATSLGDTLGTEIGSLSNKTPRESTQPWKKTTKGSPGAISLLGLFTSLTGGIIIILAGWIGNLIDKEMLFQGDTIAILLTLIPLGGFVGAYFDSIFASTIQRLNKCIECGKITEKIIHCGRQTEHFRGVKFIKNDVVNLLSILVGSTISTTLFLFLN